MMKGASLLLLVLHYCQGAVVIRNDDTPLVNNRPIIGVLSQEQANATAKNFTSYIAASYVKDIESSGARVVPIMIGKDRAYYEELMGKINGVLFPGGDALFNQSNGYADAGQHIFELAKKINDEGDYFPLFGTCLGFQFLIILDSGRGEKDNKVQCYSYGNHPLNFTNGFRNGKMFKDAPDKVIDLLKNENITVNAHGFCIVDENLISHNLTKNWKVTSHTVDDYGLKFISSLEHTRYPFYGVQFHPEKSAFEWKLSRRYAHSLNAVKTNRYFMDFFVKECRKSSHTFSDAAKENKYLIYNYEAYFTGANDGYFQQCYFFKPQGILKA